MKINGSLVFDASSASEIQNLRVEKFSSTPSHNQGSDQGRAIFNTTENVLYYGSATAWVPIATGGNAANLQTEVNAIETSIGAVVNSAGVFVPGQVTLATGPSAATSITGILQEIATYATGKDQLAELSDVAMTSPGTGDFLRYNGTKWTDAVIDFVADLGLTVTPAELNELHTAGAVLADFVKLHAVTASAADLNLLTAAEAGTALTPFAGAAITSTNLSHLSGSTSNIQTQLNNKQPLDATLTALAGIDALTGILVETGTNTFVARSLVEPAAGVTIADPAGILGNPTFALANDLAALEGLAATGIAVRTGVDAWTQVAITQSAGRTVVTNGDGVAGAPTIDLATVANSGTGTFLKLATDTYGRVTGTAAVLTADITGLVDATYVNVTGDTMATAANLTFVGGGEVLGLPSTPSVDSAAASKAYVDSVAAGLSWKQSVRVASIADVTVASAPAAIDGITLVSGDRVLLKSQTAGAENGIYVFNGTGAAMTRAVDMNTAVEFSGATVFVAEGATFADSGWTQTAEVVTVGTTAVSFTQFSGSSTYTWGVGLALTGNTVNVNLGAGIAQLPSDEVGIDLFNTTTGAVILTDDGSTRAASPASNSKLHLLLDTTATGGLDQGTLGLFIKAAGVTNAQLANSTITLDADDVGSATVALGATLKVFGDTASGVSTSINAGGFKVVVGDAAYAQKGVAQFTTGTFAVTAGVVDVAAAGITNVMLANSTINFAGATGADTVALGETFTFTDGGSHAVAGRLVDTTVAANAVTVKVREATASLLGVASFDANMFTVTAGAVTLTATLDDLTNVAGADAAGNGDLLTKTATDWVPVTRTAFLGAMTLGDLGDVGTAPATTPGQVLVADGAAWQAKSAYYLHSQAVAASTWTVTHNLGQQFCNVTVLDDTNNVVIPQSIVMGSTTGLVVTFNTAVAGKVVVMGIA